MKFEFKVDNIIEKVDTLLKKDVEQKTLINLDIERYNENVKIANDEVLVKAEAQLKGISKHKLMLDLTEVKQGYYYVRSLFSERTVGYEKRVLKNINDIQKEVPYMKGIGVDLFSNPLCWQNYPIKLFKYSTQERCYGAWKREDVEVVLYVYLKDLCKPLKVSHSQKELQKLKDKLLLVKAYKGESIILEEDDLKTLVYWENYDYDKLKSQILR